MNRKTTNRVVSFFKIQKDRNNMLFISQPGYNYRMKLSYLYNK